MKFLVILFIFFITNGNYKDLKTIDTIEAKYESISYFNVLYDKKGNYNIAVFSYDKNPDKSFLEIFNQNNKRIFRKDLGTGYIYPTKSTISDSKLFFFQKKLFILDIDNMQLDSVTLQNNDYSTIQLEDSILIVNREENLEIYDIQGFKPVSSITREESSRWDLPKLHQDILFFKNKKNELLIFNYKNNEVQRRFDTGETIGKLLGIEIGSVADRISDYKIHNNFLYFVTIGGSLYKYDFVLKTDLLTRKNFMGDGNNAGLISNFLFTDANLDGIEDFVGAAVDYNIYCINGKDLSTLWEYNTGNENQHPIYLYDINADSIPEVFGVNYYDMKLFIIEGKTGELLYDKILNNEGEWYPTSVFVDDLNKNGNINIVSKSGLPGELIILELE